MGDLDFTNNAGFSIYCVVLVVVGIAVIVMSALSARWRAKPSSIVVGVLLGLVALGYGLYLIFVFKDGTYFVSYYVFVLPVLWAVRLVQARVPGRRPKGHGARSKQFKQQVKAGEVAYQEHMAQVKAMQDAAAAQAAGASGQPAAAQAAAPTGAVPAATTGGDTAA